MYIYILKTLLLNFFNAYIEQTWPLLYCLWWWSYHNLCGVLCPATWSFMNMRQLKISGYVDNPLAKCYLILIVHAIHKPDWDVENSDERSSPWFCVFFRNLAIDGSRVEGYGEKISLRLLADFYPRPPHRVPSRF